MTRCRIDCALRRRQLSLAELTTGALRGERSARVARDRQRLRGRCRRAHRDARDRSRPSNWRRASRIAATIAGVTEMHGGSPDALGAERRLRVGLLDERGDDVGHVEERRQQVVGEAGVADAAVDLDDLLHHRQPEALGDAALDLAEHATAG